MLKLSAVKIQRKERLEKIGERYSSTINIGIAFVVLGLVTLAIVLPLVLIDSDDDTGINATAMSVDAASDIVYSQQPIGNKPQLENNPVFNGEVPTKEAPVSITTPYYTEFDHPLYGLRVWGKTNEDDGCPYGEGVSVLFGHKECAPLCEQIEGCVGYTFESVQKLCTFFAGPTCWEKFIPPPDEYTKSYMRNIN